MKGQESMPEGFQDATQRSSQRAAECTKKSMSREASEQQSRNLKGDRCIKLLIMGVFFIFSGTSQAQISKPSSALSEHAVAVNQIEVKKTNFNTVILKIHTTKPIQKEQLKYFMIHNPERLVVDLVKVRSLLLQKSQHFNFEMLQKVDVVHVQGLTRLVIHLNRQTYYALKLNQNEILIRLHPASKIRKKAGGLNLNAPHPVNRISNIDFQRTKAKVGRVMLQVSHQNFSIDVKEHGENLLITLGNTEVPKHFQRKLDVVDFETPVQTITIHAKGQNTAIDIQTKGVYKYTTYQVNHQFFIDVISDTINKKGSRYASYNGKRITMNFQDIPVRQVLRFIAKFTGLNVVVSDSVSGHVTLRLDNIPWDQALDICESKVETPGMLLKS